MSDAIRELMDGDSGGSQMESPLKYYLLHVPATSGSPEVEGFDTLTDLLNGLRARCKKADKGWYFVFHGQQFRVLVGGSDVWLDLGSDGTVRVMPKDVVGMDDSGFFEGT